jgi:broad specificity phosphatase PhoE/predicted kinase
VHREEGPHPKQTSRHEPGIVVVLRGLPGVGKTTIAALIRDRLAPAVRVNIDTIRYLAMPRLLDTATIAQGELAAAELARSYAEQGVNAIIDGVMLEPDTLGSVVGLLSSAGLPVSVFNVTATLPHLLARNNSREFYDRVDEDRIRFLYESFTTPIGELVSSDDRVPEEVADDVLTILSSRRAAPRERGRRVYFMRHGAVEFDDTIYPDHDRMGLSFDGRNQVLAARSGLTMLGIERIVTSPFPRARESAEIINQVLHVPMTVDTRFKERCFPSLYGRTFSEIASIYGEGTADRLYSNSSSVSIPGAESVEQAARRTWEALQGIVSANHTATLVVSHGGPHGWICAKALGLPAEEYGRRFTIGHARLSAFAIPSGRTGVKVLSVNTDAHSLLGLPPR